MKRPVYISGPMTGLPEFNFPAFHEAAAKLRDLGLVVVNPAEHDEAPEKPWAEYLRKDIKLLMDCDGVALLPGWEKSKGARLEVHIARQLGMNVWPIWQWIAWAALRRFSVSMGKIAEGWRRAA